MVAASEEGVIICPYCQDSVPNLVSIDSGMRLRLQQNLQQDSANGNVPDSVCDGCYKILHRMISKGATLRAEAQAKETNRLMLWRNRVALVKQAKAQLAQKNYSDAAVSYEKYLRVLEIVYEKKSGELSPELFKGTRMQEMTVITSVYWDLMRIYDTHVRYLDRQKKAAAKLAQFVRFTPIFPHIMRKAEAQTRTAKNPGVFKEFLKLSNASRPRCFIATSAYDGQRTDVVETLCIFRDQTLKRSAWGRRAVAQYYNLSPALAESLDRHPRLKPAVRLLLSCAAFLCAPRRRNPASRKPSRLF